MNDTLTLSSGVVLIGHAIVTGERDRFVSGWQGTFALASLPEGAVLNELNAGGELQLTSPGAGLSSARCLAVSTYGDLRSGVTVALASTGDV